VGHPSNAEVKNASTPSMPSWCIQEKFYLFTVYAFASVFKCPIKSAVSLLGL
jgi:hypothetical protein